ncbi:MAG TPA: hypothetical protein VFJ47_01250, partial [Terriglobales bacterium]|nr:hypothetical protein [Terriglobales bacterium]
MAVFSPYHQSLYRRRWPAVILALALAAAVFGQSQSAKRTSKGPRALGLLELAANGKAHLVPITILAEGKFYDAGAYKAAPVPMALESQTVYEAMRTGVSQGLFTITNARELKNNWIADGTWLPAGAAPPKTAQKAEDKPVMENEEGPPKLRRGPEKPAEPSTDEAKPQASSQGGPQSPIPSTPPSNPSSSSATTPADNASSSPQSSPQPAQGAPPQEEDKNRPILQRGKPKKPFEPAEHSAQPAGPAKKAATSSKPATKAPTAAPAPSV